MRLVEQHFRYLPKEPIDGVWGVFLSDTGDAVIPAGAPYPPSGHPSPYHFDWREGRRLDGFQLVFILEGKGALETDHGGKHRIRSGQVIMLFPQEWHRYRPDPSTGWHESWVGFQGDYVGHLMRHFFTPAKPVISFDGSPDIRRVLKKLVDELPMERGSRRSLAAAAVLELVALLHQASRAEENSQDHTRIERARLDILMAATQKIDWIALARRQGMSHSSFRRRFREVTGRSPLDYQIEIRINQAMELLRHTKQTVEEIAEQLGYANVHFFSRQFKERTGVPPRDFRNAAR